MAAQELRWLTYLLTDLGERPRSSPILYVDNKAMIALCQEHRPEHRTKQIALRYFLARDLQQCGQLRLAYVATQANTADHQLALPCLSRRPAGRRAALCSPRAALCSPPRRPLQPARRHLHSRTALLRAALLAGALLPAQPGCSPPCCLHRPFAARPAARSLAGRCPPARPAAARPAERRPAGRRPAARAPPSCPHATLVLTFDHEGRPIQFDTWLDDLQLYLLSDSRDSVSLFDHTSGASLAPPASADSATRSLWLTRDAAARLAVRNHLPLAERAHFGQHKTAKAQYDAVVARYSSPAIAALGRLILPYLFPKLSAFATVEDLITDLRTNDTRYRTAFKAEFLDKNLPLMYITLYFIVTRLPDSLRAVRDHFLALDPSDLTVDRLEKHLIAAKTSVVVVGAARGTLAHPSLRGVRPPPLPPPTLMLLLLTSLILRTSGMLLLLVGSAAAARAREAKVEEVAVGVVVEALEVAEVAVGVVAGVRASVAAVVAAVGVVVAVVTAVGVVAAPVVAVGMAPEGRFWRWPEAAESEREPYAPAASAEGDCYLCVPPDPGIEATTLGASESALPGTASAEALHTFMLDSGASRCFPTCTQLISSSIIPVSSH
ncbi:unnamed protein product, partial [Closterium sp. NIES-53]